MASKLTLLFATFALFMLLAKASSFDLQYEFEEDEENQRRPQQQRCQQEFVRHQRLRACQRFIRRQTSRGPRLEDELVVDDEDEENQQQQRGQQDFQICCQQLRNIDPQCRCPVLRRAVRIQQQRTQGQQGRPGQQVQQQVRRMHRIASNIPNMCQLQPSVTCPFGQQLV
ncbi:sweet protein mabinlin-2-like [Carica papaya]|uniref:sweet protein mabinlin-2-like n=1 Tax=Carica papaya TaxID=3649 RepID=UPI000B8C7ED5|nr:sweet protein mabinlin-2-like [Carica papaya]